LITQDTTTNLKKNLDTNHKMTNLIPEGKQEMNSEDGTLSKEIMHISEEYNSANKNQKSGC